MAAAKMGRHLSSAWAVHSALLAAGFTDIPECLVFGLGASAWYHLAPTAVGSRERVLRFAAPNRIGRSFEALNIYAGCYNILSREAYDHLYSGLRNGGRALVTANRFALPFALPSALPSDGEGVSEDCTLDFALLATAVANADGSEGIAIQGPGDESARQIGRDQFERAWFYLRGSAASATFFWYHVVKMNWVPAIAIPFALHRYVLQMSASHPSMGSTGLRALSELADLVEAGDLAILHRTARCASSDGGLALCRDTQAGFLREAAQRLDRPMLAAAADLFDTCGALWRRLMEDCLDRAARPASAADLVRRIMQTEAAAITALGKSVEQSSAQEGLCLQ